MRSAARDDSSSPIAALGRHRKLGVAVVTAALSACSIYQSNLLDDAAAIAGGGDAGEGATTSSEGGNGNGSGYGGAGNAGEGSGAGGVGVIGGPGGEAGEAAGGSPGGAGGPAEPQAGAPGAGGTSSNGGSGGGGLGSPDLIDGFEDQDLVLERLNGRSGVWYAFDDGTAGTAGPSPLLPSALSDAPAELGTHAMHVTATGFTLWGSGLGTDFRAGKRPYDASGAKGIRFWARVGAGKNTRHRLQLVDATTDELGGKCNPAASAPDSEKCGDHFGKNLVFTTSWAAYSVSFAELTQSGDFGLQAPSLTAESLYGLQITAKQNLQVDLWLDEIEFF